MFRFHDVSNRIVLLFLHCRLLVVGRRDGTRWEVLCCKGGGDAVSAWWVAFPGEKTEL